MELLSVRDVTDWPKKGKIRRLAERKMNFKLIRDLNIFALKGFGDSNGCGSG